MIMVLLTCPTMLFQLPRRYFWVKIFPFLPRLAHFFNENDALSESSDDEGFSHRNFHPRLTWTPLGNPSTTLTSFIITNNIALSNLPSLKSDFYNLNPLECTALKNLASNRQIIIKPADKGSSVVIMNTNDYISEAFRDLWHKLSHWSYT